VSLLRYPGGKTRLVKKLWPYIEAVIIGDHYAEPFAGGGSTFLHVARQRPNLKISINDKDADVANFWSVVCGGEAEFVRLCTAVQESQEPMDDPQQRLHYWHYIRDTEPDDPAQAAFRFLLLNRTCWGGQINSSPMGGYEQDGWMGRAGRGLACNYYVDTILANLHEARRSLAGRTKVTNLSVFDFLGVVGQAGFYFDPPYFPGEINRLYREGMSPTEHQRLADGLREFRHPWVLSYDNSSTVRELYAWASLVEIAMRSSHRSGRKNWKTKVELLILPASHNRERIQPHRRTSIPHALTALSSYGLMEANNASRKENMNANKKKTNRAKAPDNGTDQAREPSLVKSDGNDSVAFTLTAVEQLLTGRRKLGSVYEDHPLAAIFPPMSDEELQELAEDIRQNGLREAIVRFEGKILDGRNRDRACRLIGTKAVYEDFNGSDPAAFVLSKNIHRRNLQKGQRAAIAAELLLVIEKEARERKSATNGSTRNEQGRFSEKSDVEKIPPTNGTEETDPQPADSERQKSRDIAGTALDVNPHYVSDAKAIMEKAPDLHEQLKQGKITMSKAKREWAKRSPEKPSTPKKWSKVECLPFTVILWDESGKDSPIPAILKDKKKRKSLASAVVFHLTTQPKFAPGYEGKDGFRDAALFVIPTDAPAPEEDVGLILQKPSCLFLVARTCGEVPKPEMVLGQLIEGGAVEAQKMIEKMWPSAPRHISNGNSTPPDGWQVS
jgi:site-specific DNA-adenine methylase/ParB-like chromosome segregation protein Spo0J